MTNEEKAKEIGRKWYNDDAPLVAYRSALQMAKWKEQQMIEIEKAVEWLQKHTMKELCMKEENSVLVQEFIEDFKQAMMEE